MLPWQIRERNRWFTGEVFVTLGVREARPTVMHLQYEVGVLQDCEVTQSGDLIWTPGRGATFLELLDALDKAPAGTVMLSGVDPSWN